MRKYSFSDLIGAQPNVILALGPTADQRQPSPISSILTTTTTTTTTSIRPEKTRWSCHKDILKSSSNYFDTIFNHQFQEAEASIVFLPRGIFTSAVLDDVLYFMYTKSLIQQRKTIFDEQEEDIFFKKQQLDHLQAVYMAADYLGMNKLCSTVNNHILNTTHNLVCYCHSCTLLVPQLLSFTGPNQQNDPRLSKLTDSILKLLIVDPEKTLPTFWSSPVMASLLSQSAEMESLHIYLQERLLEHVNKNNAIETLYGCFLASSISPQAVPLMTTHKKIQQIGSKLLTDHFDFYCTKYPKLLSCVDGITYSFDFLDYLLSSVLNEQMNEQNACSLYKGIVRSLIIRDIVQQTPSVKRILQNAKNKIIQYVATHLTKMKELDTIDKSVIEQLAQDLVIPVHALLLDGGDLLLSTTRRSSNNNTIKNCSPSFTIFASSDHHHKQQQQQQQQQKQEIPRWNIKLQSRVCTMLFGQASLSFKIGQRVKLLNRPVSTTGTVLYVGKLDSYFDTMEATEEKKQKHATPKKFTQSNRHDQYLGIELDRSVGSNDGSVNGKRYFTTLPNRGIFVKLSDVTLV